MRGWIRYAVIGCHEMNEDDWLERVVGGEFETGEMAACGGVKSHLERAFLPRWDDKGGSVHKEGRSGTARSDGQHLASCVPESERAGRDGITGGD